MLREIISKVSSLGMFWGIAIVLLYQKQLQEMSIRGFSKMLNAVREMKMFVALSRIAVFSGIFVLRNIFTNFKIVKFT